MRKYNSIILRSETKPFERRTALTPSAAEKIIEVTGMNIQVEECPQRIFPIELYEEVGCLTVPRFSWYDSTPDSLVMGLKELPEDRKYKLANDHVFFAHVYKDQAGADEWLKKFKKDRGTIFDLEFLTDASGNRIAAFGYWAGYTGAALGLDIWYNQQRGNSYAEKSMAPFYNKGHLNSSLHEFVSEKQPRVLIIGANGRCGKGAYGLLKDLEIEDVTLWGSQDTKGKGPIEEILDYDILLNCVYLKGAIPPFLTKELLTAKPERKLSVISDVSCDPNGPFNPLPIYDQITTMENPVHIQNYAGKELVITAIDHLPSLLPLESSEDFCNQLMPYFLEYLNGSFEKTPWQRTYQKFTQHIEPF